jgi:phytoene/squalene synthetase
MSFSARSHEDQRLFAPFWLPRMPVAGQQLLLRSARQVLRRSSTFTYLLSLLLPRKDRTFFWVWYAYLRWVDDTADDSSESRQDGCKFLDRQMRLLRELYEKRRPQLCSEEEFLATLVAYDCGRGGMLQVPLKEMLAAIRFDIERHGTPADHSELYRNYDREVSSYLFTIAYFCSASVTPTELPAAEAARGAKIAHILRDFIADCSEGQFNVSRQEIDAYRLEPTNLGADIRGAAGRRWVAAKVRIAERQLRTGLHEAKRVDGIRYRAIVAMLVAKYQTHLFQNRLDRFLLGPKAGLRWRWFGWNLLTNLAIVFSAPDRPARAARDAASIRNLISHPWPRQILLAVRLHPICNRSIAKLLDESLAAADISHETMLKMRRRFIIAYWLGYSSCAFIEPPKGNGDAARLHLAGLVYAFWSLTVIELDSLVDEHSISQAAAQDLVTSWLDQMARAIKAPDQADGGVDRSNSRIACGTYVKFDLLARALQKQLTLYSAQALECHQREEVCETFIPEAGGFLTAQINSRDQKSFDPAHDWSWYFTEVLNQKTLGFALAPMTIWCRERTSIERRTELTRALLTLNSGYGHWQLLDDIADLHGDTAEGLITAPGFILLSQGEIARVFCERVDQRHALGDADGRQLLAAVRRSQLLCDEFLSSPLCDAYRHCVVLSDGGSASADTIGSTVRCALANGENDLGASLPELCSRRRSEAEGYLAAMRSGDSMAALRNLNQSGAPARILAGAREEAARDGTSDELASIADPSLLMMLRIMERLIARCHHKACGVTRAGH